MDQLTEVPKLRSIVKVLYCWRCQRKVPMLEGAEEHEFLEAFRKGPAAALAYYESVTGYRETVLGAIIHHKVSLFGPERRHCGKPLRTPDAKQCMACGCDS